MKSPTGHRHNRITPPERADQLIGGDVPLCDPAFGADVDLTRIEAALKRLDIGSFGYCLYCGDEIGFGRLDGDPTIESCVDCSDA